MKKKDLVTLIIAIVIFAVVGYIGYSQLGPKSTASTASKQILVPSITPIDPGIDSNAQAELSDPQINVNYYLPYTYNDLGNTQPFGH